jgi:hypothetical protein
MPGAAQPALQRVAPPRLARTVRLATPAGVAAAARPEQGSGLDVLSAAHSGDIERLRAMVVAARDSGGEGGAPQDGGGGGIEELVQRRDGNGFTALALASEQGHACACQLLLEARADADARTTSKGNTPLMWAAARGHEEAVKRLLMGGASLTCTNATGDTALMWASAQGRAEVVMQLLSHHARSCATRPAPLTDGTEDQEAAPSSPDPLTQATKNGMCAVSR